MAKRKVKTDEQIASILDQHIRFTTGYADSRLVKERVRVLDYYDGTAPLPTHAGNSKYVSQDVFETVESLKATLLEVFSTNNNIVEFTPSGAQDVEPARIATEYCSYIVFRQNDGMTTLNEVMEDGLLARTGVVQFSWEEETKEVEGQLGPATMDQLSSHPEVADENTSVDSLDDHGNGTYTANLTKKVTKGRVVIEAVPPEDFGISARAVKLKKAKLCYRRKALTMSDLLAEGYSQEVVDSLQADASEMQLDLEKDARFRLLDTQRVMVDDTADIDNDQRVYTVYYCYALMDIEGTGIAKLWHVCKCGPTILSKEKVSIRPFATFTPVPKAHSFYGNNLAGKVMPIQNAKTVLTRSILDHVVITNTPRWQVVKGGLMNPKELMDNRVGGLVNVTRADAVSPLPQAPLNPFVYQTLQMMDTYKEDTTGASKLSKGLNRDAISTQNSADMIEDLVALSDRRSKLIARQFSEFLKELYIGIYQLVLDHQDYADAIQVAGNWVPIDPRQWRDRTLVTADIAVGYGEQATEAEKLIQFDTYMAQKGPIYGPQQSFNVIAKALMKKGYKDITNYIVPPAQQQQPPPNPEVMADIAAKQADAEAKKAMAQATLERVQFEREKWQHEFMLQTKKETLQQTLGVGALMLKERSESHREQVDNAEIALQQKELEEATIPLAQAPFTHPNG